MDTPLHPPLRISCLSATPLPAVQAQAQLAHFVANFQQRTRTQGGDTTISVQLEKFEAALRQEVKASKETTANGAPNS
ncbi:hypothetical protein BOTBODRAFT_169713 [Botryobasidium botryosum FD-172 SS1]|uniref:Uncharacterized protein n=1 Tax=Botryobasidium botryosum (strain FD-172 SS1) TaxID=930990 RepID=A0A067NA91_BOTB1|nr:hypothetical protein BOTBODRAFT_169713 [Botryobasidium botryosum FD-172 SS1]